MRPPGRLKASASAASSRAASASKPVGNRSSSSAKYFPIAHRASAERASTTSKVTVAARSSRSAAASADSSSARWRSDSGSTRRCATRRSGCRACDVRPGRGREPHEPLPSVDRIGSDGDEAVVLELAQQAADVPRVEAQPAPQLEHGRAVLGDLEQQPRRPERPARLQVRVVEHPDALRVRAVEPAEDIHDHFSDFSQITGRSPPTPGAPCRATHGRPEPSRVR